MFKPNFLLNTKMQNINPWPQADEIQERLIKNKTLLNVVEPTLENTPLEVLLGKQKSAISYSIDFFSRHKTHTRDNAQSSPPCVGEASTMPSINFKHTLLAKNFYHFGALSTC